MENSDWKGFLEGILSGLSRNESGENKCTADLEAFKPEIVKAIQDIYEAYHTREYKKAYADILELVKLLSEVDSNCHFKELSVDLVALTTEFGMMKLAYRLATHGISIFEDITQFVRYYETSEYNLSGKYFGNAVKLTLNFSIE